MTKLLRLSNAVLGRVGLELRAAGRGGRKADAALGEFYRPAGTCQVRELATLYRLFLGERREGLFVEVGAFDGISFSNSSCLADAGWHGVLIEPIPRFAQQCRERYRGNDRIRIIEAAVGAGESQVEITVAGPFTSTNGNVVERYRSLEWSSTALEGASVITVPQRPLDGILEEAGGGRALDVLIVDVEGAEDAVFSGFSLERWRPRMIIVELSHTHPDLHAISAHDALLQRSIASAGYAVVYKDSINTVLAREEEVGGSGGAEKRLS
ncbi:MAG TPA: FkbM family methyltransferase [Steroidobacteraceae bacterium]|jgi:FkbM family methyltransferase|nr:FkbM family methyltransferase [Steroidobacteraceae bacterium]